MEPRLTQGKMMMASKHSDVQETVYENSKRFQFQNKTNVAAFSGMFSRFNNCSLIFNSNVCLFVCLFIVFVYCVCLFVCCVVFLVKFC